MAVKLDISPCSVVVYCTECPFWRAFAWDREEGYAAGILHEERIHDRDDLRRARNMRRARRAAKSI